MGNKERVDEWRKRTGNQRHKNIYKILTTRYGIPSSQAQKMKSWGKDRIEQHLFRFQQSHTAVRIHCRTGPCSPLDE